MRMPPFHEATKEQLTRWAKQIRYFRVVASEGYNKESDDRLCVCFKYSSADEYIKLLQAIGIEPVKISDNAIIAQSMRSYSAKEIERLEHEVEDVPGYRQPGICEIDGLYVFAWAYPGILFVTYSYKNGPAESVIDDDVVRAARIEKRFEAIKNNIIDPPVDADRCFCPKYYPHAFS